MHRLGFYLLHFNILVVCGVLAGAFGAQFLGQELPCPLCILQRMAMLLCALGPASIIATSRLREITVADFCAGYGLSILAAVLGASISTRQILLHIIPPDPGFGDAVLGLHLYTWALLIFVTVVVMSGLNLVFCETLLPTGLRLNRLSQFTLGLLGLMIIANLTTTFALAGLHWLLPDNPEHYQLFQDLTA